MTQVRVVAVVAACQLLLLICPAALAAKRLHTLPRLGIPHVAHLMDPSTRRGWPQFIDASSRFGPSRLASPRYLMYRGHPINKGPRLSARTRGLLLARVSTVLPRYNTLFRRIAEDYRLPASLLAAQSYIESKWRPTARYRRAAGMMMLTPGTARVVGVRNRLSPTQSIRGGARYLDRLRAKIPPSVPYPDRNLFALAAYNMGLAHLQDARLLARRLGLDPNLWSDVREVLPLMTERRYYSRLPHGFVRGRLVVRYVDRILRYQAVIAPHIARAD